MMKTIRPILLGLALAAAGAAQAYELGGMTCEDMGNFASDVFDARGKGTTKADAIKALEKRTYKQADIEKRNLTDVINLLYGQFGDQLYDHKAAYSVIFADCKKGQEPPRPKPQKKP